jgi:hypothetical protein
MDIEFFKATRVIGCEDNMCAFWNNKTCVFKEIYIGRGGVCLNAMRAETQVGIPQKPTEIKKSTFGSKG